MTALWLDYQRSVNSPIDLQRFNNSVCALPYIGMGTQITEEMLRACVGEFTLDPQTDKCEGPCSMGVDVGPKFLDVRISSFPYSQSRERGAVRKAEFIGKVKSFSELGELVERFGVRCAVIDAEPEVREALKFREMAKCSVFICYTREKKGMTLSDLLLEKVKEEKKFTMDRTTFMDCCLATWRNREQLVPRNLSFLSGGQYIAEMTNPTRVLEVDPRGNEKFVWTSGLDHSFLADVYDFCAMQLGYFSTLPMGQTLDLRNSAMVVDPMDDLDIDSQMG
jgi:hypothetical protein